MYSEKRSLSDSSSDEDDNTHKRSKTSLSHQSDDESSDSVTYRDVSQAESRFNFSQRSSSDEDDNSHNRRKTSSIEQKDDKSSSMYKPYNEASRKMMEKMGFRAGEGLGKHGQGRVNIVEASKQRGRRGLGLKIPELEPSEDVQWSFEDEEILVEEYAKWIPECQEDPPIMSFLRKLPREGPKKLTINDETHFCDQHFIDKVVRGKNVFDNLEPDEMKKARTKCNPFETIRGGIFQNRAAMKMANLDCLTDFMFTNPVDQYGESLVSPDGLLYFADVCAGPGGFSEYVLWRKKWECKGFGFTLRGSNDFKLHEFFAGPAEMFEPHYGKNGMDGDGDVYVPENAIEFKKFVLESTDQQGVHFVMADGGFSVEGQENIQEILSKRLYLCQFMFALSILRTDGHFVCKLFDIFTPFSVGLVYLMYRCFKHVSIHKPNTSRPANSERYIICKWRRENTKDIHDYMFELNCRFQELENQKSSDDILEIVPLEMLMDDTSFSNYIKESNEELATVQILNLAKIKAFAQNTELYEKRQSEIREQCLALWKVPDEVRASIPRVDPNTAYSKLIGKDDMSFVTERFKPFTTESLRQIGSIHSYKCLVSGSPKDERLSNTGFILGLGRTNVMKSDGKNNCKWRRMDLKFELPKNTIIYAELVNELKGEGRGQRKIKAIHIIDALFLGGKDVRHLEFTDRLIQAEKLTKAVMKPSRLDYSPLRVKEVYDLKDLDLAFERLDMRVVKNLTKRMCYTKSEDQYFIPSGIYFFNFINPPWIIARSKRIDKYYYFNTKNNKSTYVFPDEAKADFKATFKSQMFWAWELGTKIMDHQDAAEDKVHKSTICDFIEKNAN